MVVEDEEMFSGKARSAKKAFKKYKLNANPHWEVEAEAPNDHVPALNISTQTKPFCSSHYKSFKAIS
jgi:hypothetical protein